MEKAICGQPLHSVSITEAVYPMDSHVLVARGACSESFSGFDVRKQRWCPGLSQGGRLSDMHDEQAPTSALPLPGTKVLEPPRGSCMTSDFLDASDVNLVTGCHCPGQEHSHARPTSRSRLLPDAGNTR